jgi:hypothetical protein
LSKVKVLKTQNSRPYKALIQYKNYGNMAVEQLENDNQVIYKFLFSRYKNDSSIYYYYKNAIDKINKSDFVQYSTSSLKVIHSF